MLQTRQWSLFAESGSECDLVFSSCCCLEKCFKLCEALRLCLLNLGTSVEYLGAREALEILSILGRSANNAVITKIWLSEVPSDLSLYMVITIGTFDHNR